VVFVPAVVVLEAFCFVVIIVSAVKELVLPGSLVAWALSVVDVWVVTVVMVSVDVIVVDA
jgi:hypothetical protein